MKINLNTKVSELIKANDKSIDAIASLSPHFNKLRNPILRKILAPRVTIADAAKIGKVSTDDFINKLKEIGFYFDDVVPSPETVQIPSSLNIKKWNINFDARPIIDNGDDPFNQIIKELKRLNPGEVFRLITPFEPIPLIKILEKRGFKHQQKQDGDSYYTFFWRLENVSPEDVNFSSLNDDERIYRTLKNKFFGKTVFLDVSTMEMPQPMLTVISCLDKLEAGYALEVFHRRIPHLMLPELESKGYLWIIHHESEDKVFIFIYKD